MQIGRIELDETKRLSPQPSTSDLSSPSPSGYKLILIFLMSSSVFSLAHHRLAASEIAKFQDQLIKRLIDDMSSQMETLSPSTGAITVSTHQLTPGVVYDYDWNFARAFLYSLTVLTTIGEFEQFFLPLYGRDMKRRSSLPQCGWLLWQRVENCVRKLILSS